MVLWKEQLTRSESSWSGELQTRRQDPDSRCARQYEGYGLSVLDNCHDLLDYIGQVERSNSLRGSHSWLACGRMGYGYSTDKEPPPRVIIRVSRYLVYSGAPWKSSRPLHLDFDSGLTYSLVSPRDFELRLVLIVVFWIALSGAAPDGKDGQGLSCISTSLGLILSIILPLLQLRPGYGYRKRFYPWSCHDGFSR